jgi:hypothetical protein
MMHAWSDEKGILQVSPQLLATTGFRRQTIMELTTVYDCMGSNLGKFSIPAGVKMAGYITGSGGVPWTEPQFAMHPDAIRIDQSPVNTAPDETADLIDLEQFAATFMDLSGWVPAAWDSWHTARRPGQRKPTAYSYRSNLTPVANALNSFGITSGVNLFLSEPMTQTQAEVLVNTASGPFPIIGVQFAFLPDHDVSVVSTAWLNDVSGKTPVTPPKPGTQAGWRWCTKCTGLFFGPQTMRSHCPAGGIHIAGVSHDYSLPYLS